MQNVSKQKSNGKAPEIKPTVRPSKNRQYQIGSLIAPENTHRYASAEIKAHLFLAQARKDYLTSGRELV